MFFRLYKTRIKCLCKNYEIIFWSFGFPILLAIFFYMGFSNLSSGENLDTIPIAVVMEESGVDQFLLGLNAAEISEGKKMFDVQSCTLERAEDLLDNSKIAGYIVYKEKPTLYVKENGIQQTIIKSFIDSYERLSQTAENIITLDPNAVNNGLLEELANHQNYVVDGGENGKKPNFTLVYFYSLIALTCMFGTSWGFREMIDIQADQSAIGARISVAPIHKMKLLICNLLAAFTLHFISIMILLAFLDRVLKIQFGGRLGMILLTCLLGSLCGISLGAMVCVTVKANVKVRGVILNVIIMGGGFLSGMMIVEMKYLIATKAPIIGFLNPSSLITDAFYCLYYYNGYGRFFINLCMLGILTIIFSVITYLNIRRREYASI